MDGWSNFFLGQLGASAALAGLLFVSVSVNQARILELGRMADRGLEALVTLFLVIVVASLPLVPAQPLRLLGGEIFAAGAVVLLGTVRLQRVYLETVDPAYRLRTTQMVQFSRLAVTLVALAGLTVLARGDDAGFYLLVPGFLLSFCAAGANAWVLLIEINR